MKTEHFSQLIASAILLILTFACSTGPVPLPQTCRRDPAMDEVKDKAPNGVTNGVATEACPPYLLPTDTGEPDFLAAWKARRKTRLPARTFRSIFGDVNRTQTVTSERVEARASIWNSTVEEYLSSLRKRLGDENVQPRDKVLVETDTEYRDKFFGLDEQNNDVFKADVRVRVYRDLVTGEPLWKILCDTPGDWAKLEIKAPAFHPELLKQIKSNIRKTTIVILRSDINLLMSHLTYPKNFQSIIDRTKEVVQGGRRVNHPGEVEAVIHAIGRMHDENLALASPKSRVRYRRRAYEATFKFSPSALVQLEKIKALRRRSMEARATTPDSLSKTARFRRYLQDINDQVDAIRASLREGASQLNATSLTGEFRIQITVDQDLRVENLESGKVTTSRLDERVIEQKTPVFIAELSDEELGWIGATAYALTRNDFESMETILGSRRDEGKRSRGTRAAPRLPDEFFDDF